MLPSKYCCLIDLASLMNCHGEFLLNIHFIEDIFKNEWKQQKYKNALSMPCKDDNIISAEY